MVENEKLAQATQAKIQYQRYANLWALNAGLTVSRISRLNELIQCYQIDSLDHYDRDQTGHTILLVIRPKLVANNDKTITATCNPSLARIFFYFLCNQNRFRFRAHDITVMRYCWFFTQQGYRIATYLIPSELKIKFSYIVFTNFTIAFGPIEWYHYDLNEFLLLASRCLNVLGIRAIIETLGWYRTCLQRLLSK